MFEILVKVDNRWCGVMYNDITEAPEPLRTKVMLLDAVDMYGSTVGDPEKELYGVGRMYRNYKGEPIYYIDSVQHPA